MDTDIAIVGFGPVGATLAGLLGRYGLRVTVIEKDEAVFPLPRAAHVDHTGLRTIQEIGCLDRVLAKAIRNRQLDLLDAKRELLVRIPADQESISGLPTSVYFYQPEFDAVLRDAAARFPHVSVHLNTEMTGICPADDHVVIDVRAPAGERRIRASWLVGCDGARSPVREAMGLKLRNLNFDEKWLVLDLRVNPLEQNLPVDHSVEICDPARPYLSTPIAENRQRFEFMLLPGEDPEQIKQDHVVRELLASWLTPGSYRIERVAVYTFHGLVAERWRSGRVLIAGDAAHQTPPFLGQGMCAGIRDAANLAWKLNRVTRFGAPQALLDTYGAERIPHAVKVIEAAIRIGKVVCELDPAKASERDRLLRADDQGMREGLSFALPKLEQGPLVLARGGGLFVQPTIGGKRLDDIIGSRFFVLGRTAEVLGEIATWWKDEMDAYVAVLADFDTPALRCWLDRHEADVAVVRPDRYVMGCGRSLEQLTAPVRNLLAAQPRICSDPTTSGVRESLPQQAR